MASWGGVREVPIYVWAKEKVQANKAQEKASAEKRSQCPKRTLSVEEFSNNNPDT
jgi:hypothetical protein